MRIFLFVLVCLLGCTADDVPKLLPPPPPQQSPTPEPAPRVHTIAEQQAYNCRKMCSAASLRVSRFVPGKPSVCECGAIPAPPQEQGAADGLGTGVEVGIGMEVGKEVTKHVIREFLR